MSKIKKQSHNLTLPPLQKKIVLCLAKEGDQTINEINRNIPKANYKATYTAFKSLEEKGLIKKVSKKEYRGQPFDTFWLSNDGLMSAVFQGANPDILRGHIEKHYGMNEDYEFFLDWAKSAFINKAKDYLSNFKSTRSGRIELKSIPLDLDAAKDMVRAMKEVTKKYPKAEIQFEEKLKQKFEDILKML